MTVNYCHTSEIIPKVINNNKEVFLNEIMISKENLKSFLERDTYLKACEKLNVNSTTSFTIKEIEELDNYGKIMYVEFFDNYINESDDSKSIVLVFYNNLLRYFRVDLYNNLYEINLDYEKTEKIAEIDNYSKEKVISYISTLLTKVSLKVPVGISNRHVHLTKEDFETLFGKVCKIECDFNLSQPGQYASKQKVTIKTEKGEIENVRVIGPLRNYTQIEISKTDAYKLKLNPPVRDSGDLANSESITIVGPEGEVTKKEGCIIANRHIHLTGSDLIKYGLNRNKTYKIKVNNEKGGILDNVHLKIDENFVFELHIDTDDANAFFIKTGDKLEIID